MTFVQRFDSTLGCFVHFHVLVPDGVFTRADAAGSVVFREGPAPTRADIAAVGARVEKRMRRWLRRRRLLDEQRDSTASVPIAATAGVFAPIWWTCWPALAAVVGCSSATSLSAR